MAREVPRYRYRGNVKPSAEVHRPVAAARAASKAADEPTTATLDLFDVIDSWGGWWGISAGDVDKALATIGNVDTLHVRVNSPGGEALEGVAIGNLLRAHASQVHVTVYGLAASAASAVAMAGDQVSMAPGAMMMIHDPWNITIGNPAEMRKVADTLDKLGDGYASLYAGKAGGTAQEWRAAMQAETWYTADEAVEAGLADAVGLEATPSAAPTTSAKEPDTGFDAAASMFDLSVFDHPPAANAGRDYGTQKLAELNAALASGTTTPAEQPVTPPTNTTEEADTMSETIPTAGLCKALGLADGADEDAILDALDAKVKASQPQPQPNPQPPAPPTPQEAAAVLQADGKAVVSQVVLDELREMAQAGVQARARQQAEDRDKALDAAVLGGKISAARKDFWRAAWDKDPEGTAKDLEDLPARFPVAQAQGYQGNDESVNNALWTDAEAQELAGLVGLQKEALTNG